MMKVKLPVFFSGAGAIVLYAFGLGLFLFGMSWLQMQLFVLHNSFELYAGAIALAFTALGIWLARKLTAPRVEQVMVTNNVATPLPADSVFAPDPTALAKVNLSRREMEVLELMARGLSNGEIAERLFVSLNTVKTHSSNLYSKLDAKRRTQAVDKAKQLKLIP